MIKKYTVKEFSAYGSAGTIAQETLSSIRTVFSLGLQKKKMQKYLENLLEADQMSTRKAAITSTLIAFVLFFFKSCCNLIKLFLILKLLSINFSLKRNFLFF